jgi:hypothetical protein
VQFLLVDLKDNFNTIMKMEFIDDPQIGHNKFKLPVLLVPVLMFVVLGLGIFVSKLYVSSVLDKPVAEESQ